MSSPAYARIVDVIDDELAGMTASRRLRVLVAVREKIRDLVDEAEEEDEDEAEDPEDDEDDDDEPNDAHLHY